MVTPHDGGGGGKKIHTRQAMQLITNLTQKLKGIKVTDDGVKCIRATSCVTRSAPTRRSAGP